MSRLEMRVVVMGLLGACFSSCAVMPKSHCCRPEKAPPPAESRFVKLTIPMTADRDEYTTWRTRSPGRPVLLLHALNGMSPSFLEFALEMETWGYRVYMPSFYGDTIDEASAFGYDMGQEALRKLRVNPKWKLRDPNDSGEVLGDVNKLAQWVSEAEGGRQIAVIGNCLTGMFPLAALDEPSVRAVVLAQPAMPVKRNHAILFRIPQVPWLAYGLTVPEGKLEKVYAAMRGDPKKRVYGFHYRHDPIAATGRFDRLHHLFRKEGVADQFTAFVLTEPGSPYHALRSDWTVTESSEEIPRMLSPHSTIINPENRKDRDWFRARLREALAEAFAGERPAPTPDRGRSGLPLAR